MILLKLYGLSMIPPPLGGVCHLARVILTHPSLTMPSFCTTHGCSIPLLPTVKIFSDRRQKGRVTPRVVYFAPAHNPIPDFNFATTHVLQVVFTSAENPEISRFSLQIPTRFSSAGNSVHRLHLCVQFGIIPLSLR